MNITADEIMNVVYRSFYVVNEQTINAGMDDKTLRTVRKHLNELVEEIKKNAIGAAATANDGKGQ